MFVEVTDTAASPPVCSPGAARSAALEVVLGAQAHGERVVRVYPGFDCAMLADVVRVLESAC